MKWARCAVDAVWHAVDDRRDHPPGVFEAECGHRLPTVELWDEPYGAPCQACAALQLARAEATTASATTCASGKRAYASAQDARAALLDARIAVALHGDTKRHEQRYYTCPRCRHWHLTSSPPGAVTRRRGE